MSTSYPQQTSAASPSRGNTGGNTVRNAPPPAGGRPGAPPAKPRGWGRLNRIFWAVALSGIAFVVLLLTSIAMGAFGPLPTFEDLENPKNALATELYTSDSVLLGKYYIQNRSYTSYAELPKALVDALIATEDIRFRKHAGIDMQGLGSIFIYKLRGKNRGASTITQQLAKNLFGRERSASGGIAIVKLKEWITASKLEKRYTKEEIIALYFNTVEFGHNAFGIKSAAKTYFTKELTELTTDECALLVGMLKGIETYNPRKTPEAAFGRRNVVLGQMLKYGYISQTDYTTFKNRPVALKMTLDSHATGMATYFREVLRQELIRWCAAHTKSDGSQYNLYRDGLRIYVTLDSKLQKDAEEATTSHMRKLQKEFDAHWAGKNFWTDDPEIVNRGMKKSERYVAAKKAGKSHEEIRKEWEIKRPVTIWNWKYPEGRDTVLSLIDSMKIAKRMLHTGFMAMDPRNGHVKAWVGGINFKFTKYDHVNLEAKRQVGSAFKPFVYYVAIDNGYSPKSHYPNQPVRFPEFDNWTPRNYDGSTGGSYTMPQALARSLNNVAAYLIKQVGPNAVIDQVRKMGMVSPMDPYPSLALGSFDASVYEMTGAFASFANGGTWHQPQYVLRILDRQGNRIDDILPVTKDALNEVSAWETVKCLQYVVQHGTARAMKFYTKANVGGKTGTTQNNSDGWFMMVSPNLVAGCWVGAEDRSVHFRTTKQGGGAHMALPLIAGFIEKAERTKHLKLEDFVPPSDSALAEAQDYLPPPTLPAGTPAEQEDYKDAEDLFD